MSPRAFILFRQEDVTGVSGVGTVAEGVEFSDGTVALRWTSKWPTSVVFHDRGIESVAAVHGHDGRTQIVWVDEVDQAAELHDEQPVAERIGHIPSHSPQEPGSGYAQAYITIDRSPYRVRTGAYTGEEIRRFVNPPIDEHELDLWLVRPGDSDLLVGRDTKVPVPTSGLRFFTTSTTAARQVVGL